MYITYKYRLYIIIYRYIVFILHLYYIYITLIHNLTHIRTDLLSLLAPVALKHLWKVLKPDIMLDYFAKAP